jgi:serine/threonine protein kinase/WD40 repeat protein
MSLPPNPDDAPVDAAFAALEPGFLVGNGRFTLVRLIGRGGMGVVWLARDESLREDVALKFLPPEIRFDAVALDDLRRETARARKLTHPNIIRIHDLFKDDREAFISMEYVDGPNLSDLRIEQSERVFTWRFLEPLVKQLCEALDYAHSEKVIHRDLKPANMMLDSRGRLKLSDFGIAAQVSDSITRVSMLRHGQSGTITHMSPQQMDGKLPQVTDDIYALGATLYELLTSQAPFFTGDIAYQVRNLPPQPVRERLTDLRIHNDVPKPVAAMIMACLGKTPEQRPQTAGTVAEWIGLQPATTRPTTIHASPVTEEVEGSPNIAAPEAPAPPVPAQKRTAPLPIPQPSIETVEEDPAETIAVPHEPSHARSRKLLIGGVVTAVVLAGFGVGVFGWWLLDRGALRGSKNSAAQRGTSSSAFLKNEHVLVGHKAAVNSVTFSPNQEFLVSGSADGTVRAYETSRGELKWSANADVGPVSAVTISRENKVVAAAGGNGLIRLFALASGNVVSTLRVHGSPVTAAAFSPAGTYLASADESGIVSLWDYEKGAAGQHWNAHNSAVRALAFAPGGNQLASGSQDQSVRVWYVPDGGLLKVLSGHKAVAWSLAFSTDGSMLISSSRDRSARIWNTGSFSLKKTIQWGSDVNIMHGVAFSPDSKFIAAGSPRVVKVFKVETAARGTDRVLKASGVMRPVAFSPDGSAIAAGGDNGLVHVWPFQGEVLFGGTAPSSLASDEPTSAINDTAPGQNWITLFDGNSLDAWQGWNGAGWLGAWELLNGELRTLRGGSVGLATREQFGDFELELEWKVAPGANSGIFYRVPPNAVSLPKASPEYQIVDDATRDGRNPLTAAGSIYWVIAAGNKQLRPVGSFNTARIIIRGRQVEHWLNGVKILNADLGSPAIQRVARQKYGSTWGEATQGHIVLQNLGSEVSFRNVRIRKVDGN